MELITFHHIYKIVSLYLEETVVELINKDLMKINESSCKLNEE